MDFHHLLTQRSITSMSGLTAFSALPDAPVLAERPSRRQRLTAAWRARRAGLMQTPSLHRPASAPALVPARAVTQVASTSTDGCRMVA